MNIIWEIAKMQIVKILEDFIYFWFHALQNYLR